MRESSNPNKPIVCRTLRIAGQLSATTFQSDIFLKVTAARKQNNVAVMTKAKMQVKKEALRSFSCRSMYVVYSLSVF